MVRASDKVAQDGLALAVSGLLANQYMRNDARTPMSGNGNDVPS